MLSSQTPYKKISLVLGGFFGIVFWVLGIADWRSTSSVSFAADPAISGPNELCIVFGAVIGTFHGGGDPSTDVYYWEVVSPTGTLLLERSGGNQFEQLQFSFQSAGTYQVKLRVRRNSDFIFNGQKSVTVRTGPTLVIEPDYLICEENPAVISAMDPADPTLGQYRFKWTDSQGAIIGNTNTVQVSKEGQYFFEITSLQGGCLVNGNTFAGPSLDFKLTVSNPVLCKGSDVVLSTDTPIPGEWTLIRPGSTVRESLGNAFEVILEREELQTTGTYIAIFSAVDPAYPDCKSTRRVTFEINEAPILQVTPIQFPDNCGFPNGILELTNLVPLDSLIIEELDAKWTNLASNTSVRRTNLFPQMYTLIAYSEGCRFIRLYDLKSKEPPIIYPNTPTVVLPSFSITEESCGPNGVNPGMLQIDFTQGNVTGKYRILGEGVGEILSGDIADQSQVSIEVPGGAYYLEVKIDGCTYPIEPVEIKKRPLVEFSVPDQIAICKTFDLIPETSQSLRFTMTYPDGTIQELDSGTPFNLTDEGEYTLIGVAKDPASGLCPKVEKFNATVSEEFSYQAVLVEEDCFGNQVYEVDLDGINLNQVSIRWINSSGTIVGRNAKYYASFTGQHNLVVQPLKSGYCETSPYAFLIEPPILSVDIQFTTAKICPDPGFAEVSITTTQNDAIETIEWIYFDDNGNRKELPEYANKKSFETNLPGNYEVVVYNRIGCEIGREFTKVEASTLLATPSLENRYGICSKNSLGPKLNPGSFATYRWYFEGNLISENPEYMPNEVGNYALDVITADGCFFGSTFSTFDLCFFEYVMTDAMVLGDSNRQFEAWINEGITDAEVFIINRQGELIYYEKMKENPAHGPVFVWNGMTNGKSAIPGTYAVVLKVSNPTYGFAEKITQSLLVIE